MRYTARNARPSERGSTMRPDTPTLLGVVNITADSFSDGGKYLDADAALAHARRLLADGAHVIDLGAASTHPDAEPVAPEEEIRRLAPVLAPLVAEDARVSVDSYHPAVQRFAIAEGAALLNDTRGFAQAACYPELAAARCDLILMHSIQRTGHATREATDPDAVFAGMFDFFADRLHVLEAAGVARERVILDPGMGFFLGANPEVSLHVLRHLPRLHDHFGCRVLVCVSRKSFLGALTGQRFDQRGAATLAAELHAAQHGVHFIRTHDVRALRDGLAVARALAHSPAAAGTPR